VRAASSNASVPCRHEHAMTGCHDARRRLAGKGRGSIARDRPRTRPDGRVRPCPDDRARRRGAGQHRHDLVERTRRSPCHEPRDPPGIPSRPGKTVRIEAWPEEEGLLTTGACGFAAGHRAAVNPPAGGHLKLGQGGPLRPGGRSRRLASLRRLSHSRTRLADGDGRCVARAPARSWVAPLRGRRRVVRGPPWRPR
jgi:hypothetical protein